jgi:hypothetical protein
VRESGKSTVLPSRHVPAGEGALLNHDQLFKGYPDILADRPGASFNKTTEPSAIADALGSAGVVVLRGALSWWMLSSRHRIFKRFVGDLSGKPRIGAWHSGFENVLGKDDWFDTAGDDAETDIGSKHMPWVVRDYNRCPAAIVIAALLKSWTWPVVEQLAKSTDIAILLRLCVARHTIDRVGAFPAKQDVSSVGRDIPFMIWMPFHRIALGRNPGLGFVTGPPPPALAASHDDPEYVSRTFNTDAKKIWVPAYKAGDISIHGPYTPYFTTCSGVPSDSYSLEIRATAREAAPLDYQDPAIYVGRRDGKPTVVGSNCSDARHAKGFVALLAGSE